MVNLESFYCMNMSEGVCHRVFWRSIFLALTLFTVFLVINLYNIFLSNPTMTTLENSSFPVTEISFPGIAVCSLNKISKQGAENLAERLSVLTGYNSSTLMEYIRFIGQLYDFDFHPDAVDHLLKFQKILNAAGLKLIKLIRDLAIPCQELLEECSWRKIRMKCSDLFKMRLTHDGYCCVFNYMKKTSEISDDEIPKIPFTTRAGIEYGLKIVINNNLDDYFYSIISSRGVTMQVFVPTNYPDKTSGSLDEILLPTGSENFLEIKPRTINAVDDVVNYAVDTRHCLLDQETQNVFNGTYSYSDCIVGCRVESSLALCQCVSFKIPVSNDTTVCTLEDLQCLNRYRNKWFTLTPDENVQNLDKEIHDSLRCSQKCYPSCSRTHYNVEINTFPIHNKTLNGKNTSIAYIYYGRRVFEAYKQDVMYYWYEILSNFGGLFGILVGLSIISLTEFFVFVLQKSFACFVAVMYN